MEIRLDRRALRQLRLATEEAMEEGDTETLREDIVDAFTEEQIEEIERRLDNGDFYDFVRDTLEEWSEDDVGEMLELLETQLREVGVNLTFDAAPGNKDDEEEDDDDD